MTKPCTPGFFPIDDAPIPSNPVPDRLLNDYEFITDFARFSEGILDEKFLRRKYRFSDDVWTRLGENDALIKRIELEKVARQRSGATKRELAQKFVTKGPAILATIMDDPKQSARHRVDSIRALDALADPGPQAATQEDRIHIVINLGADERVVVDAPINPTPPNNTIDVTPQELPPTTPRARQTSRKRR